MRMMRTERRCHRPEETEETAHPSPGILGGILDQKGDRTGKTGEI